MKRQFMKSLMALCTGVMTLVAASSLFVSCYDDSKLREDIGKLDQRLKVVEQLKSDLDALTARVNGLYTLQFDVTSEGEIQYSFDGKTWTSTGIELPKNEQGEVCECPEVAIVDNGESVTVKIGNAELTIDKPQEIAFELRSGKLYFMSEATEQVIIKSSGIEDITVMSAPKGWWAEINSEGLLEITAPDYATTQEDGYYDDELEEWIDVPATNAASGYVKIHACAEDGKCMVGKLAVEVVAKAISVKAYSGKAYFNVAEADGGWASFYYGVSTKENLEVDTAPLFDAMAMMDNSVLETYAYSDNESVSVDIAELLGAEPELGKEYVVWAVRESYDQESYSLEDLVIAYYSPVQVSITEVEAERTAYNVTVDVEVLGVDRYLAYATPAEYFEGGEDEVKERVIDAISYGANMGQIHDTNYTGSAYDISNDQMEYAPLQDLYVIILPLDGRPNEDYTTDDVYVASFTTAGLESGGAVNVSATKITEFDYWGELVQLDPYRHVGVIVDMPETGWNAFYYEFMSAEDYNLYSLDDALLVEHLLKGYGYTPGDFAEADKWPNVVNTECSPARTYYFVAFAVDTDGKYGQLAKVELTTAEVEKAEILWDDAYTTNLVDGVLKNTKVFEFTPSLSEEVASYKYLAISTDSWQYDQFASYDDADFADFLYFAEEWEATEIPASELVDGKLVVEFDSNGDPLHQYGYSYLFAIIPITPEGLPGNSAAVVKYDCVFELDALESTDFPAAEPTITFAIPEKMDGGWGETYYWKNEDMNEYQYSVSCHVVPVEGSEVKVLIADYEYDYEYVDFAEMTELQKASALWSESVNGLQNYISVFTAEGDSEIRAFFNEGELLEPVILVCWTFEGKYYYKEISLAREFKTMLDDLNGVEPSIPSPAGKQWDFNWTEYAMQMGREEMSAVIDLGVSQPDYFMAGIDYEALYGPEAAGMWMAGIEGYFEVEATDETSGKIWLLQPDMATGDMVRAMYIEYYDYTGTTCTFNDPNEAFYLNDVKATLRTETVTVMSQGIAQ